MTRILQIMVFSCAGLALSGCNGSEKNKPIWEDIKIGDLAPTKNGKRLDTQLLKTINFDVHIFEIPAENTNKLDDVRRTLSGKPLRFYDYNAFSANLFSIGFAQIQSLDQILFLLHVADGKKARTVSIMLPSGQTDDLAIATLRNKQTISYIPTDESTESVTIGPGQFSLRIKAEKISDRTCNVTALPVFSPPTASPILQLAPLRKSRDFFFTAAGFRLKMSPGDFIFLAPQKYVSNKATLGTLFFNKPEGSLFFSKPEYGQPQKAKHKPAVRVFLLICTGITD